MGNILRFFFPSKKVQPQKADEGHAGNEDNQELSDNKSYEDEAKDAANLALSMNNPEDDTTTYELSIACEGLPKMDSFSLTDPMVVVRIEQE